MREVNCKTSTRDNMKIKYFHLINDTSSIETSLKKYKQLEENYKIKTWKIKTLKQLAKNQKSVCR